MPSEGKASFIFITERKSLVLLLLATVGACGPDAPSGTSTFQLDTLSNGTILVENNGTPSWSDDDRWVAREILRIGSLDEHGPEQFGTVSGLAIGDDGAIFVAEGHSNEIRVFRRDGSFSHTFGAEGEGPAEFRGMFGIRLDPVGNLWVRDAGNDRFSVFSPDGGLIRSISPGFFSRSTPWQIRVLQGDHLLDWDLRRPQDPGTESRTEVVYLPLLIPLDLSRRDTFPPIVYELDLIRGMQVPKPFSQMLVFFVGESGEIWFGESKEYRIFRRDISGDTTLIFTLPASPQAVSDREKRALVDTWTPGRKIPVDDIPDDKPVLARIIADDRGHVLVFPELEGVRLGSAVDVFSQAGVFLGRVELPVVLELRPEPVSKGGKLFGITKDGFDVPYVVGLSLERAQR